MHRASVPRSAGHIAQPPVFVGPRSAFAPRAFLIPDSPREVRRALEACLNKSAIGHAPIGRPARQEPFHGPGRLQQPFARRRTPPLSTPPANALTSRPARAAPRYIPRSMFRTNTLPQAEGACALRTRASALKGPQRCVEVGSRPGRAGTLGGDRSTRIECASLAVPPGSVVEGRCHCGRERRRCEGNGGPSRGPRLPVKVLVRRTEMKETPRRGYCTQAV